EEAHHACTLLLQTRELYFCAVAVLVCGHYSGTKTLYLLYFFVLKNKNWFIKNMIASKTGSYGDSWLNYSFIKYKMGKVNTETEILLYFISTDRLQQLQQPLYPVIDFFFNHIGLGIS
ncbi:hypothetical protein ACJX0J_029085, partial [Zea mays]